MNSDLFMPGNCSLSFFLATSLATEVVDSDPLLLTLFLFIIKQLPQNIAAIHHPSVFNALIDFYFESDKPIKQEEVY